MTIGGGGTSSSQQNATLEPHLAEFGGGGGTRYPNPFFDLAQQYTPRTVKELFRWCTYFYYTNPLVGATITKISKYPITDIIIEESDQSVKEIWEGVFHDHIKIKDRLMEVNLDLNVYGNAFVSMHLPFTRFLVCQNDECRQRTNIKDLNWKWSSYRFAYTCPKCKKDQVADPENPKTIKDVPYRVIEDVRVIRWNPENIAIRYNEATAETTYYYNVSRNLRHQIIQGEKDILQGLPLLFILAVKHQRLIRLSSSNLFHLKRPTLAEKDMGWGKPLIQTVLKDLYYMATLRRAQEAIANEHIVPFDFLFPQPNAQMDPFVHTDLGNWRNRVEEIIRNRRRDPNFKAILPVPIGFGRLGGDGKALMLTPELNYLNQTVVGGMGIPQEFLFGGLNWTGSSVTLRSLQNDFEHNQSQLLELTRWMKNKIKVFMRYSDIKNLRFMDFRMADDIQRIQQLITLNAQRKVSDETLLTELGLDYEKETRKIMQEIQTQNEMQDIMARAQAKTSGEAQIISYNYQQKIQELSEDAAQKQQDQGLQPYGGPQGGMDPYAAEQQGMPQYSTPVQGEGAAQGQLGYLDQSGQPIPGAQGTQDQSGQNVFMDVDKTIATWAKKLLKMEDGEARRMLTQIKAQMPAFGQEVEKTYNAAKSQEAQGAAGMGGGASAAAANPSGANVNMSPMPEKGAPTRAGSA